MAKKQMTAAQLRNLPQYRDIPDEQLEEVLTNIHNPLSSQIDDVIARFEKDYDLTDMTANDLMSLRELAKIFIILDSLDNLLHDMLAEEDWVTFERITKVAAQLRSSASQLQVDLNITRKARSGSEQSSVIEFIENLKTRSKSFLKDRMIEVYCPKCHILVAKFWMLHSEVPYKLSFVCSRGWTEDGDLGCGYKFEITNADIQGNKNIEVGPAF
jgi:hypothetical protein